MIWRLSLKLVFCIALVIQIKAQTIFLPNVGTTWHYVFGQFGPSTTKYNAKIEYTKDTIYGGDNVKILYVDKIYNSNNYSQVHKVYIKQRNDSVWFLHTKTNNTWQLLINYNATVGQNWKFNVYSSNNILETFTISVNSVSTVTINNITLKSLNVTTTIPPGSLPPISYTTTINERLGDMRYLLNMNNIAASNVDYVENLLCYQDSTFGLMQFTSMPCNYTTITITLSEFNTNNKLNIYPNPTNEIINVELNASTSLSGTDYKLEIMNALGQIVQINSIHQQTTQLNVSELVSGVYFVKITSKNKIVSVSKFIKE